MPDETITRFRRDSRATFHHGVHHDAPPHDDTLPALSLQHMAALHRLYDPILHEPVPGRMLDLLRRYGGVHDKDDPDKDDPGTGG